MGLPNHAYTSNSHNFIPTKKKKKSKFIQQYLKLHTMQNFINHQHCPNLTISNNSTIQKCPKIKNQHDHTMIFHQIIQCPKFPQKQTIATWQCPTINFSTKYEINKFTNKKLNMSSPWNLSWMSVEYGCLGLEGAPLGWVWSMEYGFLEYGCLDECGV